MINYMFIFNTEIISVGWYSWSNNPSSDQSSSIHSTNTYLLLNNRRIDNSCSSVLSIFGHGIPSSFDLL